MDEEDENISTHTLRKEGDDEGAADGARGGISTHTLRKEGDGVESWRRLPFDTISTHTLRKEGDPLRRLEVRR